MAIVRVAERAFPALSLIDWLRIAWLAGSVVFLIPVASALWRLSMIRRTGLPAAWHRAELSHLATARGVSRPVELLEHEAVPGPMTFGVTRPVIVGTERVPVTCAAIPIRPSALMSRCSARNTVDTRTSSATTLKGCY